MKFKDYFKKNLIYILSFPLIVIAVYLPIVFNKSYCADLEYVQGAKGAIYNWNELGRYTLILLKKISFTPYNWILEGILFIIVSYLTLNALAYFMHLANSRLDTRLIFILSGIALIFPTFCEQYYFKFQAAEVLFGIFLLCLSGIFLIRTINDGEKLPFVISVVLTTLSFGIYQSMPNILLVMYIGLFLILCCTAKEKRILKNAFITVVIQFVLSFMANYLISHFLCKQGSYFSDKIMWNKLGASTCISYIKHYFKVVLLADSPMYSFAFIVALLIAYIALFVFFSKDILRVILTVLSIFGLIIAPFGIAIIQGFEPDTRTQLALPFSIAFLLFFALSVLGRKTYKEEDADEGEKKDSKPIYFGIIFLALVLALNLIPSLRLVYTRYKIIQSDREHIQKIAGDLKEYNCLADSEDALDVIIIGTLPFYGDSVCVKSYLGTKEYILFSAFELDAHTPPTYFFSTNRILSAMETEGYYFKKPKVSNNMEDANNKAKDMPKYPENGYIKQYKHYVLVNLSR